jgi:PAS domain S-box-containing protein
MKVLIVDDTPANLRLLRAVLEGENFAVVEAADGVEALQVLERGGIDAVISDILMPNMDGYRFCHEVRQRKNLRHLPLIIYSSTYNSPADAQLALDMGADKYIKKPAPIKEITAALEEIIRRGPRPQSPPAPPQKELSLAKLYNETLVNKLEQKNHELSEQTRALQASEEKFRQLAENINEVFWIVAADRSEFLYVSPAYEKIWGRTCRSLYRDAKSFVEAIHEGDRVRVIAELEGARQGRPFSVEYRVIQPDGQARWVHDRGTFIRNAGGEIYRLAGIAEDITQRKNTEAQLRQAQKMEAVGQLASGVAHDFNNLLTLISVNLDLFLMAEKDLPSTSQDLLNEVMAATNRASTLSRQLLTFSRRKAAQMQVLNLNQVVLDFTRLIRRILGDNVKVETQLAEAAPPIEADPGMLEQIMMNMALNARDAMPMGGQVVIGTEVHEIDETHAAHRPKSRPGRYVGLYVSDTGTGIDPENLPHIFEPFFTTKEEGKGTGLGLATVFSIAEQHHGWVEVSSRVHAGATFRVFLPVASESHLPANVIDLKKTQGAGEKILIVEDDKSLLVAMSETLQRHGYVVVEANSGISARRLWAAEGRDVALLLTDVVLPEGMNGLELAEMLRHQKPALKVLIVSGYDRPEGPGEAARPRHFSFLKKPFSSQSLAEAVRKTLDPECEAPHENTYS